MNAFLNRHDEHAAVIGRVLDGNGSPEDEQLFDELHLRCGHCRAQMLADDGLTEPEFEAYSTSVVSKVRFLSAVSAYEHARNLVDVDVVSAAMVVMRRAESFDEFSAVTKTGCVTRSTVELTRDASSPTHTGRCSAE